MAKAEFDLTLFAIPHPARPDERLEVRMKRFLEAERTTESLDEKQFSQLTGANDKADYLMGSRRRSSFPPPTHDHCDAARIGVSCLPAA